NYEVVAPAHIHDSVLLADMRCQLNVYFNLTASMEYREQPCLVLSNPRAVRFDKSSGLPGKWTSASGKEYHFKSCTPGVMLGYIDSEQLPILIDETGISYPIDLTLTLEKPHDAAALQKAFAQKGLELKAVTQPVKMLVIRENSSAQPHLPAIH